MTVGGKHVSQAERIPASRQSRGEHDRQGFQVISFRKSERGQELAEFALVLPLLFLVLYGVLDLGRFFHAAIVVTSAAREGARFGTIHPDATAGEIGIAARNEALNSGIDISSSPVSVSCTDTSPSDGTCDSGHPIEVRITFDFDLLLNGLVPIPSIQMVYSAVMMVP